MGVQELTLEVYPGGIFERALAVGGITEDGVANGGHVHTNLVGASGVQGRREERVAAKCAFSRIVGAGVTASRHDAHALAVARVTGNRSVYKALWGAWSARNDDHVLFEHCALLHLSGEVVVGGAALGYDNEAAGVFVKAMYYAGTCLIAHIKLNAGHMGEEGVHKSAATVAGRGVDHHTCRLVYHQ
jgi:hypothetical protein